MRFVRTGIVLYAFLVPAMYAGLRMHERTALLMERETPLANARQFLHSSYVPQYWFWQLIEVRACIGNDEPASAHAHTLCSAAKRGALTHGTLTLQFIALQEKRGEQLRAWRNQRPPSIYRDGRTRSRTQLRRPITAPACVALRFSPIPAPHNPRRWTPRMGRETQDSVRFCSRSALI